MSADNGGPAFPQKEPLTDDWQGMTLRDYFAAKAMAAFISAYPCQAIDDEDGGTSINSECIAADAFDVADAMLKERSK